MQTWACTFTSEVFLPSSSVVSSRPLICASGQRLSFPDKTGDLTKQRCDENHHPVEKKATLTFLRCLDEESVQASVAAWHLASPSSLFALKMPGCDGRSHVYSYFSFPSPGFTAGTSENRSPQHSLVGFAVHFISFISEPSWISPSRSSAISAKHKKRCWFSFKGIGDWAQLPELDDHYVIFSLLQEKRGQLQPLSSQPSLCWSSSGEDPRLRAWGSSHLQTMSDILKKNKKKPFRTC